MAPDTTVGQWLAGNRDLDRLDRELLASRVLKLTRAQVIARPEAPLSSSQRRSLDQLAERRRCEPWAYITGEKEFFGLCLAVGPGALVPRPETERLVELVIERAPQAGRVLDLGTGSGCIAVAVKAQRPDLRVTAADVSTAALEIAQSNAERHGADVEFLQSDWFSAIAGRFGWIACNPPYIADADPALNQLRAEPPIALVGGRQGLAAINAVITGSGVHLEAGGTLVLEHGRDQGKAVRRQFADCGFTSVETHHDLAGHPRISLGRLSPIP
ncbi:MAG: peptide chain release factor N(5)-glutamine methyltransferase [Gammaproteobacteria bacterium]|nr:peptide chain release factor N(5)-glutamine methyltransferase [Gammaproteobacteria bacterium]MYK83431.1 peptide chain release factor N(5)-glutamine methyltransferase [Gammaproteobacteria bacterium]